MSETNDMELADQYRLAAERYQQLTALFTEVQTEIYDGEWRDSPTSSDFIPGQGGNLSRAPEDATSQNSYYFRVDRWHVPDQDLGAQLAEIAASWQARQWEVSEETVLGDTIVRAITPEGFLFFAEELDGELTLSGRSPVYWGDQRALLSAISDRVDAEDAAEETSDATNSEDDDSAYLRPGQYREFPAWDTLDSSSTASETKQ